MTSTKFSADIIIPERAPSLWVPLRFFLAGALFLAGLLLLALWQAPMLAADWLHNPVTLAVTHLFTLGLGGSVVSGAVYQMTPVLLHSSLHSERMANLHLLLHTLGTAAMVAGFYQFETAWVILGGTTVLTGAILFVINLAITYRKAERWNWHGIFMVGANLSYFATLIWGIVMALNQRYGFLGEVAGAPLTAHLALGLLGWFGLMIAGVGLKLVPMFAPGKPLPAWLVASVGAGLLLGVPGIVLGLFYSPLLLWLSTTLAALGLLGYAGGIWYSYRHRRSGPLDFSVRFAITGAAVLPLMLALPFAGHRPQAGLVMLYAMGWVGATILGMLLRIIPFMVWLHRFRNRVVKNEKIPFLHQMLDPRVGWVTYVTWFPGTLLLAAGLGSGTPALIMAGALVCLVGLAAFGAALAQILRHVRTGVREG